MQLDKAKFEYQRRSDQAMQLRREITDRQKDLTSLQSERHERQMKLESERDRLANSQQELEAKKIELTQKRIELEKADALKDLTIRQVQDVSPKSFCQQVFAYLFVYFTAEIRFENCQSTD